MTCDHRRFNVSVTVEEGRLAIRGACLACLAPLSLQGAHVQRIDLNFDERPSSKSVGNAILRAFDENLHQVTVERFDGNRP